MSRNWICLALRATTPPDSLQNQRQMKRRNNQRGKEARCLWENSMLVLDNHPHLAQAKLQVCNWNTSSNIKSLTRWQPIEYSTSYLKYVLCSWAQPTLYIIRFKLNADHRMIINNCLSQMKAAYVPTVVRRGLIRNRYLKHSAIQRPSMHSMPHLLNNTLHDLIDSFRRFIKHLKYLHSFHLQILHATVTCIIKKILRRNCRC